MSAEGKTRASFNRGHWLALMLLALLATWPSTSSASTPAPMCNELAQTIEAPPVIWGFDGGTISEPTRCLVTGFGEITDGAPSQVEERVQVASTKCFAFAEPLPAKPAVVARVTFEKCPSGFPPGYMQSVYRPPRS